MDTRIGFELISLLMASRQERERYQDDPDGYLAARGLTPDEARSFRAGVAPDRIAVSARISARKRYSRARTPYPTLTRIVETLGAHTDRAKLDIPFGLADQGRFRDELRTASPGLGDTCGQCLAEAARHDEDRGRLLAQARLAQALDGPAHRRAEPLPGPAAAGAGTTSPGPGVHHLAGHAMLCSYASDLPALIAATATAAPTAAPTATPTATAPSTATASGESAAFTCRPTPSHLLLVRTGRSDIATVRLAAGAHAAVARLQAGTPASAVLAEYGPAAARLIAELVRINVLLPAES
ncbi:hypothetical protein WN990_07580 [Kitasatospora purpeofusca]|uniref:hypothetical protein n=1 Tax=Kitasatospora purpeofusca TaxID=67352 RepID=UPI0030F063D6